MRWVTALVTTCVALGACGYAAVEGDPLESKGKPNTTSGDDGGDVIVTDAGTNSTNVYPVDASAPGNLFCLVGDLALCLTFEGNTADSSAVPMTPTVVSNLTFVAGKVGQAASFSASSALRYGPNAAWELPTASATIEAWIDPQTLGTSAVIFDDDTRFSLSINAAGKIWCQSSTGSVTGQKTILAGQWAHVACVIDGGLLRAYVDGVEDAAGSGSIASNPTAGAAVGGNSPDGEPFIGAIDSLRVFRVARTPAQLAADALP